MALKRKERTCVVCGKKYFYCPYCDDDANKPRWMFIYHNEACKDIDHIASDFEAGDISQEDAMMKLNEIDLSNKENFNKSVLNSINKIYNIEMPIEKAIVESPTNEDEVKESKKSSKRKFIFE